MSITESVKIKSSEVKKFPAEEKDKHTYPSSNGIALDEADDKDTMNSIKSSDRGARYMKSTKLGVKKMNENPEIQDLKFKVPTPARNSDDWAPIILDKCHSSFPQSAPCILKSNPETSLVQAQVRIIL